MTNDAAARLIASARQTGTALDRLPEDCRPTTDSEAFSVQRAVADLLGLEVGAWKVSAAGPNGGTAAPIFVGTIHAAPFSVARINTLETEIALKLNRDLPARPGRAYTRQDVMAAICSFALAFEIVDWRLTSPNVSFAERIADCFANDGMVLGNEIPFDSDFSSPVSDVVLTRDGLPEPFSPVDIDPVDSLRAYVNRGGDLFGGLKAGQWVLTGSMTGLQKVTGPSMWHAAWRDVTEVSVEITG